MAEEANIELQHDLAAKDSIGEEDDKLVERLRALRPAA